MTFETRALTGQMLAQRYLVGDLSRETDVMTQFHGEDTHTGSPINIDVVRDGLGADSNAARAVEDEAMTACEIRHPNVLAPRDVGVLEDGSPFVITTRFSGETLEDRVCLSGSMSVGDVVRIGLDLLSALAAAHDLGLTHGDLRPESIFLVERDGLLLQTHISGFGRRSSADARARLGFASLAFLAPEISEGGGPTIASDLYACGAILYLAATGFPPYTAPSAAELTEAVQDGALRTPAAFRPELPARLVRVLVQALQLDASRRFASARDMMRALEIARAALTKPRSVSRPFVANDAGVEEDPRGRWAKSDVVPCLERAAADREHTSTIQIDGFATQKAVGGRY